MNNKLRPALIGGVALGLLSAIPIVSAANICCCAWVLAGGALAAYLYIKESPTPVSIGDGALLGLFAGGFGVVVQTSTGVSGATSAATTRSSSPTAGSPLDQSLSQLSGTAATRGTT